MPLDGPALGATASAHTPVRSHSSQTFGTELLDTVGVEIERVVTASRLRCRLRFGRGRFSVSTRRRRPCPGSRRRHHLRLVTFLCLLFFLRSRLYRRGSRSDKILKSNRQLHVAFYLELTLHGAMSRRSNL